MSLPRIVVPDPIHEDGLTELRRLFAVDVLTGQDAASRRRALSAADGVIVRNIPIDGPLIDECPKLKVIAKHGAGVDNIDLTGATARGIVVANVPGGNADAVAEGAVALMLAALRRVPRGPCAGCRRPLLGALGPPLRAPLAKDARPGASGSAISERGSRASVREAST